jgi:hypothetical protein
MKVVVGNKQYFGYSEIEAQKLADTKILDTVNLEDLELSNKNRLGFGYYGNVYTLRDKTGNTSEKYVVKKIMLNIFEEKVKSWFNIVVGSVESKEDMFLREVKTIDKLQKWGIVPGIYYADKDQLLYVMDKMDNTLFYLLKRSDNPKSRTKVLTHEMGHKLLDLVKKYFNVPIFHTDLHMDNVMWSDTLGEFRIIDWGLYRTLPIIDGNNTKLNKTSKLYKEKIGETFEVSDRLLKALWDFCRSSIASKKVSSTEKDEWEKLQTEIVEYVKTEFPSNSVKYLGYLNKKRMVGFGLIKKSKRINRKTLKRNN